MSYAEIFQPQRQDGKVQVHWLDFVVIGAVAAAVWYFYNQVNTVLHYNWDWNTIPVYVFRWDVEEGRWVSNLIVQGFFITIRLAIWSILCAAILGITFGLFRVSPSLFLRLLGRAYVEFVRNMPPLVFIFIFYFFLSDQIMPLIGADDFVHNASPTSIYVVERLFGQANLFANFLSGVIVLALFEGAYVTEIVRAGIQAVPRGQWEAGTSLGLTRYKLLRYVVIPQAVQKIVPPLCNQFIQTIKDSSIVSLISIQELTFLAVEVAVSTTRVFEVWITAAVIYFFICWGLARVFARVETKMAESRGR